MTASPQAPTKTATTASPTPVWDRCFTLGVIALRYPTRQSLQPLRHDGVLVEIGHWGGTYPHERHAVRSLIAEHGPSVGIDEPVEEFTPFEVEVLDPVRTAVEKLMLLHAAAVSDAERRLVVARHYYDVWCLLQDERISRTLADSKTVATMAVTSRRSQAPPACPRAGVRLPDSPRARRST